MVRLCLMLLAMLALLGTGEARAQLAGQSRHIAIRLVAETDTPAAGQEVTLAFDSRPEPGWHGYWQNPGDAGVETRLDWTLPAGIAAGPLLYPVPQRLTVAGLMNYVYEGPFAQLVRLKLPSGMALGTRLPIRVRSDYLVCTEQLCVPEHADLSVDLTIGDGRISPERRALFDRWRAALPRPLGSAARFAVVQDEGAARLRIGVPFPATEAATDAYFYPLTPDALSYSAPQRVARDGDLLVIETDAAEGTLPKRIEGVLATGSGQAFTVSAQPGAVSAPQGQGSMILLALLGAVAGGLILNVMPCVFPILSLKALHLARAGESARGARQEALAYTAGVLLTCLALGGAMLALRAAGVAAGWAFQLQDSRVILLLLLLVTGVALNLAGLFTLPTPRFAGESGAVGAFATGALAAFVATPCTGPFLGAAMGAALVLPTLAALAIFAGLGLGLALPFLLLGFVPALRRRLPRPGAWMARLQRILSVPMFATALALAWVLGAQAGVDGMTLGIGAALLLGLALWWTGLRQASGRTRAAWPMLPALLLAIGAVATVRHVPAQAAAPSEGTEPFTEARLAELRASGKPVFAYFTADWCVTCKVNEKTAIETARVRDVFAAKKVAVLVGDWTDGDPALGRFLEANGRAGVPLYLWYAPGAETPQVLPQLLTSDMLARLPG
ncbi:thioredoxin family protein [Sphingomonas sp. PL-96]|uniref:protein-disulfide reductase DsbD family protein n=1 Tax=Sphingomonas sp. PL-96 TaxID=2887201 RepID=UPI001E6166FC|nr:protein-disulfide reductase DsbD domain-containing protein [Sphingomonas sp. PL-96]MCC2975725.1 thioredoxin family protein [Sphingomonas sp. PL-96]